MLSTRVAALRAGYAAEWRHAIPPLERRTPAMSGAREAVEGAADVYTDAWTSMGQEAEAEGRRDAFAPYRVNQALLEL